MKTRTVLRAMFREEFMPNRTLLVVPMAPGEFDRAEPFAWGTQGIEHVEYVDGAMEVLVKLFVGPQGDAWRRARALRGLFVRLRRLGLPFRPVKCRYHVNGPKWWLATEANATSPSSRVSRRT